MIGRGKIRGSDVIWQTERMSSSNYMWSGEVVIRPLIFFFFFFFVPGWWRRCLGQTIAVMGFIVLQVDESGV